MTLDLTTLDGHIERFFDANRSLQNETRASYRRLLRELGRWIGVEGTCELSPESFTRYKEFLLRRHARSSVSTYLVAARRFALFLGVSVHVRGVERAPRRTEIIADETLGRLWGNLDVVTDAGLADAAMMVLAHAGLGVARIAALGCDAFTLGEDETLIVESGSNRFLLGAAASQVLSRYLARRNPEQLSEPLFVLYSKKFRRVMRISPPTVRRRINWWLERAGLRKEQSLVSPRSLMRK